MKSHSIFITGLALLAACGKAPEAHVEKKPDAPTVKSGRVVIPPDSPQLSQIRTETVKAVQVPVDTVAAPGKVEANPNRLSHVALPLTGRVVAVVPKIGDYVKQGQPILTIESSDADAAVSSS